MSNPSLIDCSRVTAFIWCVTVFLPRDANTITVNITTNISNTEWLVPIFLHNLVSDFLAGNFCFNFTWIENFSLFYAASSVYHAAYCDRWSRSVVCQSVKRLHCVKTAERIEEPKAHCIRFESQSPCGEGRSMRPLTSYSCLVSLARVRQ